MVINGKGGIGKTPVVASFAAPAEKVVLAEHRKVDTVIVDGSPGIGCPVIASITGASLVLIVTEPTLSGKHDMERVADLTRHFEIPAMVCLNKWDLNPQIADEIEALAGKRGIRLAGRVRYDPAVTAAQVRKLSVVEHQQDGCAEDIRGAWSATIRQLNGVSLRD